MNIKENIINLLNNASKKTSDKFVIGDECLAWWGEPEVSEKLMNYYNQKMKMKGRRRMKKAYKK